jgi:ATP-binding cassette, subfamily B, bacterial MsbA
LKKHRLYIRLLLEFRPYAGVMCATLLALVVAALTDVLLIRQLKDVVDAFTPHRVIPAMDAGGIPQMVKHWIDRIAPVSTAQAALWTVPATILALVLARMVGSFAGDYGSAWLSNHVQANLRRRMFARLLSLPNSYFDQSSTGSILSRVTFDANLVSQAGLNVVNVAVRDSVLTAGYLWSLFQIDVKLAAFCLGLLPLVAIVVVVAGRRMRRISGNAQHAMGELSRVLDESIGGQRVVKIFGGEHYETRRYDKVVNLNRQLAVKHAATSALNSGVIMVLVGATVAAVVYVALLRAHAGALTPGSFVAFMGSLMALQAPIKNLTKVNEPLQRGLAAAVSVYGVIDAAAEEDAGRRPLARASGRIALESVGFSYDKQDGGLAPALRNITLDIAAGETVALVGGSGSGKTTLASLLPRFYDVDHGRILLDGVDIRDYRLRDLRAQIALVGQDVVLFNDTLSANIAYGDPAPDQDRVVAAARAAYADEFIRRQPQGYMTEVGENGLRLSGGQRQRIAIARALYKDAPVLILDEATSALDTASERQVQAALEQLMKGRTTVIIAHRLSTIRNADRIVVMRDGSIVETGTHDELLARGGLYTQLAQAQQKIAH